MVLRGRYDLQCMLHKQYFSLCNAVIRRSMLADNPLTKGNEMIY